MKLEPQSNQRFVFLDSLRGIAALAVFFQHAGGTLFPAFAEFTAQRFQMGQFGVSLFFLCSGYIIPRSIEKKSTLTEFWVHRFFRLYPLYWVSLLLALAWGFTHAGFLPEPFYSNPLRSTLANITMIQGLLGSPHALGPYWNLGFEMMFYWAMSALLVMKWNRRTFPIVMGLLVLSVLNPLATHELHRAAHVGVVFHFATLFFGTLFYRLESGALPLKKLFLPLAILPFVIIGANGVAFHGIPDVTGDGVHAFLPMTMAWMAAYTLFTVSFWRRWSGKLAQKLAWVGLVSYSVYLLHPLVIGLGTFGLDGSRGLALTIWTALVLCGSALSYRFIEHPAIQKARNLRAAASTVS